MNSPNIWWWWKVFNLFYAKLLTGVRECMKFFQEYMHDFKKPFWSSLAQQPNKIFRSKYIWTTSSTVAVCALWHGVAHTRQWGIPYSQLLTLLLIAYTLNWDGVRCLTVLFVCCVKQSTYTVTASSLCRLLYSEMSMTCCCGGLSTINKTWSIGQLSSEQCFWRWIPCWLVVMKH